MLLLLSAPLRAAAGSIDPLIEAPEQGNEEARSPFGLDQLRYDFRYLLRRPTHLDQKDKRNIALTAGAYLGLFLAREEIREFAQEHHDPEREQAIQNARLVSRGAAAPVLALAAYLASFATDNAREKETALMLLESAAYSAGVSALGSFTLAMERPEDGDAVRFFDVEGHGVSLDAALAAAIVEPLRCQYLQVEPGDRPGRRFWKHGLSTLLYTLAALTAYQRVDADKHWAPDAFLGTMGGLAVGRTLCEAHGKLPHRPIVVPEPVAGGFGLSVRLELGRRRSAAPGS